VAPACPVRPCGPPRGPTRASTSTGRTTRAGGPRRWSTSSPGLPSWRTTQTRAPRRRAAAGSSAGRGRGEGNRVVGEGAVGGPDGQQKQERRPPLGGGSGRHVVDWEEQRVRKHRVATSADGLRRGVLRWSCGVARGLVARPGCACGLTGRGGANGVTGGVGAARHRCRPPATPWRCGVGPIQSADRPRQPLWGENWGEGGVGGCGRHPARGPGRTPLLRGRRGTGRDATSRDEVAVWRSGVPQL